MTRMTRTLALSLVVLAFGCGGKDEPTKTPDADPGLPAIALNADLEGAKSVNEVKKAAAGDEVVVVGNIRNIVKGFASFQLTDLSLDYCGSGADPMEKCPTPWDYCCIPQNEVNAATLIVEAHDAGGKVRTAKSLGLRHCDRVAVKGKLQKDEHGNVTVVASGWFMRSRPKLHDNVRWPE